MGPHCDTHRSSFLVGRGELPHAYSEIPRPISETKWRNPNQQSELVALMRWLWLHHRETLEPQPDIAAAWVSALVPSERVVSNTTDGSFYFVLARKDSGVLAWQMEESVSMFGDFVFIQCEQVVPHWCRCSSQIHGPPRSIVMFACSSNHSSVWVCTSAPEELVVFCVP